MRFGVVLLVFWSLSVQSWSQDSLRLRIQVVGDIMGHESQINAARKPDGTFDYNSCFSMVKPIFDSADLTIGNLELTHAGRPYTGYPQFCSPDALSVALKAAGFDFLVTANNHSMDRGRKGIVRTIRVLDSLGIPHTGTFIDTTTRRQTYPALLEVKGFRLAILNYTYGTNGIPVRPPSVVNLIDTTQMAKDIREAKRKNPDIILLFLHWGLEYQRLPSAQQKQLAAWCLRKGVEVVIGGHPHVLQPVEFNPHENQLVAYSMGNFISGQRKRFTDGGMILEFDLTKLPNQTGARIRGAYYTLTWVNRKGYVITPANQLTTVSPEVAIPFELFLKDTRSHFEVYNRKVSESQR